MEEQDRSIYVVISKTGTMMSRLIGRVTGDEYNHASLSMDESLEIMYSFGRLHAYNPIIGGLVMESPFFGTFKRFHGTEVVVFRVPVTVQQKAAVEACVQEMYENRWHYGYNFLGLVAAGFGVYWQRKNHYYCSEFVRDVLGWYSVLDAKKTYRGIVKPEDFAAIPGAEIIYRGNLRKYAVGYKRKNVFPKVQTC